MTDFQKSSYCSGGACVEVAFEMSSFCASGACVEAAHQTDGVLMRDATGTVLSLAPGQWNDFLAGVAAGEFN